MKKFALGAFCIAAALSMFFVYKKTFAAVITAGQSVTLINQTQATQNVFLKLGMNAFKNAIKQVTVAPGQQATVHTSGTVETGGLPIAIKTVKVGGDPNQELTQQELNLDDDLLNRAIKVTILANGGIDAELDSGRDIMSQVGTQAPSQPYSTLGGF